VSLSPETVQRVRGVERLVLPSPNGSTVAARVAAGGATVVGVSLRNAAAAAAWVRSRAGDGVVVAVVAAGERWNDGPLRPAAEDLWGAGAFIAALIGDPPPGAGREPGHSPEVVGLAGRPQDVVGLAGRPPDVVESAGLSPEARAALAAWRDIASSLPGALADCASGRELIGNGYPGDVEVAGERTDSTAVPVLVDGWFLDAGPEGGGPAGGGPAGGGPAGGG
jgi:2-phosphosulfolactate phosphatase